MRLLLLGGTREAAALAAACVEAGHHPLTSLAGRTREPRPVMGEVRTGGFGGAEGLAAFLHEGGFDALVDATHPFAAAISANAARAAAEAGTPRVVLVRPAWAPERGDDWRHVPDLETAATALPRGAHALLALGRQHLAPFLARADVRFTARMIEASDMPLPGIAIVRARPSADPDKEAGFLRARGITHLVSRNAGGPGAYAKIAAARMLGLPVVMVARPPAPPPPHAGSVGAVMAWLASSHPPSCPRS